LQNSGFRDLFFTNNKRKSYELSKIVGGGGGEKAGYKITYLQNKSIGGFFFLQYSIITIATDITSETTFTNHLTIVMLSS